MLLRHFLPATFGLLAAVIGGIMASGGMWISGIVLAVLGCSAIVYASGIVQDYRSNRRAMHIPTARPPRPDADVAQYLNDGDRAWLREYGDWTDPSVRVTDSDVIAEIIADYRAPEVIAADRRRRAEQVVSQMDSTDGWRTTRYADGRTVEHAVTDEPWTSTPGNVLVVCPAGRYSDAGGTCAWTATVPEPAARRTRAAHLQASPFCGKSLTGRTHTPDGDPWPLGRSTEVTRRGAYASDAPRVRVERDPHDGRHRIVSPADDDLVQRLIGEETRP